MNKRIMLIALLAIASAAIKAQPKAAKDVAKSVFTLTTFKADGSLLASSHGIFTGEDGEAVSDLTPFIGASSAVVIDSKGAKMNVVRMLGINELYDAARFKVDGKVTPARLASSPGAAGSQAWLVAYTKGGKPSAVEATVKSVETFMEKYAYYIFSMDAPDNTTSCPFINEAGEVIGIMQPSTTSADIHATDAAFIRNLHIEGLDFNNANLQKIGIPVAMPTDLQQAQLFLFMTRQNPDSLKSISAINDFIELFPTLTEGYVAKAQKEVDARNFEAAAKTMEEAIRNAEKKDEANYDYGNLIYNKELYISDKYEPWNFDKAMELATMAYSMSPQPLYKHLQGQINFSKGEYQNALDIFTELYEDNTFRSPELLFESARCKQMLNAPNEDIIVLLDSAINTTDTLQLQNAAPYFLTRGDVYNNMGKYREAAFDYARYEILARQQPTAQFYYIRAKTEINGRLYQQAVPDLARAIALAPQEPTYIAEMASLQIRLGNAEGGLKAAQRCVEVAPDYSTGYVLLGLALIKSEKKEEGLEALLKAKEMGDEQAQPLIDKYSE